MRFETDHGRTRSTSSTSASTAEPAHALPGQPRALQPVLPLPLPLPLPVEENWTRWVVRRRERVYRCLLAIADASAALVALVGCLQLIGDDTLKPVSLLAVPLVVVVAKAQGLYDRDERLLNKSTLDEAPVLFQQATLYTLVVWLLDDALFLGSLGGGQALALWASLFGLTALGRQLARRAGGAVSPTERIFVLGDGSGADRLLQAQERVPGKIVGHLPLDAVTEDPVILQRLAQEQDVHRIVVAPAEGSSSRTTLEVIRAAKASGMRVSILPTIFEVVGSKVEFDHVSGLTLLGIPPYGLSRSSLFLKRCFDVFGAGLGLIVVAPLLVVIAVAVRVTSPGPALFRQTRIGRTGKPFTMLKFRSMVDGADELKESLHHRNEAADGFFKIDDDPRVTKVGRLLRRTCVDELPQLINVLRGEMSLVGPRPLIVDEDVRITGFDRRRLQLTPGMTGPWQVLGSSRVPLTEMLKLDYLYVADWSLWNDIKVLVRTIPLLIARRGR